MRDWATLLASFCLIAFIFYLVWQDHRTYPAPVKFLDVRVDTPVVKAGGEARGTVRLHRSEACPTTVNRFLVPQDSPQITLPPLHGGGTVLGYNDLPIVIPIPEETPPGRIIYRVRLDMECPITGFQTVFQPDVYLQVQQP